MPATAVLERPAARRPLSASASVPTEMNDLAAAHAYGQKAAATPGLAERPWEDVAPLQRAGWASRHGAICPLADGHDWRLSGPAVRDGWAVGHTRPEKEHAP